MAAQAARLRPFVWDWLVEGASGSWTVGFDEVDTKRILAGRRGESRSGRRREVPVASSPGFRKADNANWGLTAPCGARTCVWRVKRRLAGAASTALPPKARNAGNGDLALLPSTGCLLRKRGGGPAEGHSRKGESLRLGSRGFDGCS